MHGLVVLFSLWRVFANDGMSQFHEEVVHGRDPRVTAARFIVYKHLELIMYHLTETNSITIIHYLGEEPTREHRHRRCELNATKALF